MRRGAFLYVIIETLTEADSKSNRLHRRLCFVLQLRTIGRML